MECGRPAVVRRASGAKRTGVASAPPPLGRGAPHHEGPGRTPASRPLAAPTAWTGEPRAGKVSRQPHRSDRPSQYDAGTDAMKSANLAMENSFSFGLHSPVPI